MKKILILANNATGLYNFRFELVKRLIEEEFEVYFCLPESIDDNKVQLLVNAGCNYINTPMNRRGMNAIEDFKLLINYKQIFKEVSPDLVLTYTIKPNIYGNYVASIFNIPVIMNITGIGSSLASGRLKEVIKKMYKYACSKSKLVFFQNESNHKFFILNKLVDEKKTKIIPGSGVNIKKFIPTEKIYKDDKIKFLFIARIMKDKGIEEYLEVAKRITQVYRDVEFQILGTFEEEKYKEMIINNGNKQIKYLGSSQDVRKEIREADCIVNPSYHEGMSNILLEAGAMGKSLIAYDIPGCREIIDHNINGYLCEAKSVESLENKLINFINLDKHEKYIMGKNSRKKIKNEFDRNIIVDIYIKSINNILGRR